MYRGQAYFWLLLGVAVALQLAYGFLDRAPDFDEAIYMDLARGISRHGIPQSRPESPIFLMHPPLFFYLESLAFLVGEPPLLVARLPSTVLSLVTLWLLFRLCRVIWDENRALIAVAILAVNPSFVYYSHSVYMEATIAFLGMLALVLWFAPWSRQPSASLSGIAGGAAMLGKYLGLFFPLGILASGIMQWSAKSRRATVSMVIALVGCAAIWPLYALSLRPEPFFAGLAFFMSSPETGEAAHSWRSANLIRYAAYQIGVVTPALIALAAMGLVLDLRDAWRRGLASSRGRFLLCCIAIMAQYVAFCLLTSRHDVKYLVPVLPILAVFAGGPIVTVFQHTRTVPVRAVLGIMLLLLLTPATWLYDPRAGTWHPNIVVFGIQRDGRYRDLARIGAVIRKERPPGSRVLTEAKNSLVAYYGDLEATNLWSFPWSRISQRMATADYYVTSSDAAYLDEEAIRNRDAQLESEFELVMRLQSDGIAQALYRRQP